VFIRLRLHWLGDERMLRPCPLLMCLSFQEVRPWLFLFGGLALISVGRLRFEEVRWFETGLVTTGALLIATAHLVNWRLCCASRC
jgi:hypothetical protein